MIEDRHLEVRGIYGALPHELLRDGRTLKDYGVNAIWLGAGDIDAESVAVLAGQHARVFVEFNTLHVPDNLREHPDAAPIGRNGEVSPPPHDWQGICPSHAGYRRSRMDEFRRVLEHPIDGVWLDYHHSHANWERATPELPDTCFCARCIDRFRKDTGTPLPEAPIPDLSSALLGPYREAWAAWRCEMLTDWVREFREILDRTRPGALLGTFHCPWTDTERDGAMREKLAIDLRAQKKYIDVFSIMPYHARFGHAADPGWISRQLAWLGRHVGNRRGSERRAPDLADPTTFGLG